MLDSKRSDKAQKGKTGKAHFLGLDPKKGGEYVSTYQDPKNSASTVT